LSERTHYDELGVREGAEREEIRKAYRKLVLKFHPDRSGDSATTDRFVRISEAYKVLSDEKRRREYDAGLTYRREREEMIRRRREQSPRPAAPKPPSAAGPRGRDPGDLAAKTTEAALLFSQGRYEQAERVALLVVRSNPNLAMPHAILGDIARSRQQFREALGHYAVALQLEPGNATYSRRYEEVLAQTEAVDRFGAVEPAKPGVNPLLAASLLSGLMLFYISVAREAPLAERIGFISSWTAGLVVMLFINGVILGAALSISQSVDRWESVVRGSSGKLSPAAALGLVAVVSYWASALLYVFVGLMQRSFTYSMSRLVTAVGVLSLSYAAMAALSPTLMWHQTLLWGGNLLYLGALAGWAVADAFR
jgi:tetratricopeptide (TPR) repeat protein